MHVRVYMDIVYLSQAKLMTTEVIRGIEFTESQMQIYQSWTIEIETWIESAAKTNELRSDLECKEMATVLISLIKDKAFYPFLYGILDLEKEDPSQISEILFRLLWKILKDPSKRVKAVASKFPKT